MSCNGLSHIHIFSFKYFSDPKCLIYINLCTFDVLKKNSARLQWYSCARHKAPGPLVLFLYCGACHSGADVVGWIVDQEIWVWFTGNLTMCGPSDGKEVKDVFGRPGACVEVGSTCERSLAAHGVGCPEAGLNLKTGQLSRPYKAEILMNVTFNHNQPTNHFYCGIFQLNVVMGYSYLTPNVDLLSGTYHKCQINPNRDLDAWRHL